ncbi:MAG: PAS domain S-box protein [Gammaproteobacteria bacterium]|nr:PAS domain S-box protein [Gammaproteobacteria bacterium]
MVASVGLTHVKTLEAARQLEASERQFRAMFETASIGVAQADIRTGQWLRVNQRMCEITGYTLAEMLSIRIPGITHPDDRELDWDLFQQVVRGEQPSYRLEKRYLRKDGRIVWVNVNMTVTRDDDGEPVRTIATVEDISERKEREAGSCG